jgi:hypothetical protein
MKTLFQTLIALFLFQGSSSSQTEIPGGYVSGTWTREGSPYNVKGSIVGVEEVNGE